jgi:hypothetical protein
VPGALRYTKRAPWQVRGDAARGDAQVHPLVADLTKPIAEAERFVAGHDDAPSDRAAPPHARPGLRLGSGAPAPKIPFGAPVRPA